MPLAAGERKKEMVQIECRRVECSRRWRLQQKTSDGRLLTDGTAGRAAVGCMTTVWNMIIRIHLRLTAKSVLFITNANTDNQITLSVSLCLFVRALKGKRLELSTPKSVKIQALAGCRNGLTSRSKSKRMNEKRGST